MERQDGKTLVEVFNEEKVRCLACGWKGKRRDLKHETVNRPQDGWIPETIDKCPKCGEEL